MPPSILDESGGGVHVGVFPEAQHLPPLGGQADVGVPIAGDVRGQLVAPPRGIGRGLGGMVGARMPEAPVHEHSEAGCGEDDVRPPTGHAGKHMIHPVAESEPVQLASEGELGCGVATALTRHAGGDRR